MFPSAKHIPPPTIKVYRGNTARISFTDLKFNGEDKPTVLYGESILFIVKSPLGTTVLSKTLTGTDEKEIPIQFDLVPEDTINLCAPFKYDYSISLYMDGVTDFFTLERGVLLLKNPIGDINDIKVGE